MRMNGEAFERVRAFMDTLSEEISNAGLEPFVQLSLSAGFDTGVLLVRVTDKDIVIKPDRYLPEYWNRSRMFDVTDDADALIDEVRHWVATNVPNKGARVAAHLLNRMADVAEEVERLSDGELSETLDKVHALLGHGLETLRTNLLPGTKVQGCVPGEAEI